MMNLKGVIAKCNKGNAAIKPSSVEVLLSNGIKGTLIVTHQPQERGFLKSEKSTIFDDFEQSDTVEIDIKKK